MWISTQDRPNFSIQSRNLWIGCLRVEGFNWTSCNSKGQTNTPNKRDSRLRLNSGLARTFQKIFTGVRGMTGVLASLAHQRTSHCSCATSINNNWNLYTDKKSSGTYQMFNHVCRGFIQRSGLEWMPGNLHLWSKSDQRGTFLSLLHDTGKHHKALCRMWPKFPSRTCTKLSLISEKCRRLM